MGQGLTEAISFIEGVEIDSERSNRSDALSQESCTEHCMPFIAAQTWVDITGVTNSEGHAKLRRAFKELRKKFEPRLLLF